MLTGSALFPGMLTSVVLNSVVPVYMLERSPKRDVPSDKISAFGWTSRHFSCATSTACALVATKLTNKVKAKSDLFFFMLFPGNANY